jgi:polyferredoxin
VSMQPVLKENVSPKKKQLIRRAIPDHSQRIRHGLQLVFMLLNACLAIQFYRFVRQFETYPSQENYARPAGIEGWLPIAGLMNLKLLLLSGQIPRIHPAAMFLLIAFLLMSILLRKSFCGWLCPVGTISEWLWKFGRKHLGRNWRLPNWADFALRPLKYILLSLFGYAVYSMSVDELRAFLYSPYGLVADVKMLNFFRFLGTTGAAVLIVLFLLSIVVKNFWCRYLCPYGGLLGLTAFFSPVWIRRQPDKCIDCAKCAKACPAHLPVNTHIQIRSAECMGCLECVAVCPAEGALDLSLLGRHPVGRIRTEAWAIVSVLALVFFGTVTFAKMSGHWQSPIPAAVYQRLIPHASELEHPR